MGATSELHRIDESQLALGCALRGDVCDIHGRVLLKAGQLLEKAALDAARRHAPAGLYGGNEWAGFFVEDDGGMSDDYAQEPVNRPAQIMRQLSEQQRPGKGHRERRHERRAWAVPLTVRLEERCGDSVRTRDIEVTSHNISAGGFAFVYNQYVYEGTIVRVQFDTLPRKPKLTGVVRNCILLGGRQHRVGVQFTEAESTGEASDAGDRTLR